MIVTMMRMIEVVTTTLIIAIMGFDEGATIPTIVDSVVVIVVVFSVEYVALFNPIVVESLLKVV